MSEKTGKTPLPPDPSARRGNADDTTVKQRVLSEKGLSLESTQRMQRRLEQDADQQLRRRQPAPQAAPQVKRPATPEAPPQRQSARPPQSAKPSLTPTASSPSPARTHIKHDSRGNAVWNWAASVGAAAIESTSRLLKRLEAPELSLDDKPPELELEERKGGGYDPYNGGKRGRS
jgi:hypothetical protein